MCNLLRNAINEERNVMYLERKAKFSTLETTRERLNAKLNLGLIYPSNGGRGITTTISTTCEEEATEKAAEREGLLDLEKAIFWERLKWRGCKYCNQNANVWEKYLCALSAIVILW